MAFTTTSKSFADEIISLFLYGEDLTPSEIADDRFIGRTTNPSVEVTAADYMAGPGRFARPEFFEAVRRRSRRRAVTTRTPAPVLAWCGEARTEWLR
jgi:hypothetical protein